MVVAALASSPDAFSIVLLSTLGKGQSISATDMGWLPQGKMFHANSGETTSVVHTAGDDEPPPRALYAWGPFLAMLIATPAGATARSLAAVIRRPET